MSVHICVYMHTHIHVQIYRNSYINIDYPSIFDEVADKIDSSICGAERWLSDYGCIPFLQKIQVCLPAPTLSSFQLSVTPALGDPTAFSGLRGHLDS